MTYRELRAVVNKGSKLRGYPLVDSHNHMVLLGSIQRTELLSALESHTGRERRMQGGGGRR
jgi:hypothetical protein